VRGELRAVLLSKRLERELGALRYDSMVRRGKAVLTVKSLALLSSTTSFALVWVWYVAASVFAPTRASGTHISFTVLNKDTMTVVLIKARGAQAPSLSSGDTRLVHKQRRHSDSMLCTRPHGSLSLSLENRDRETGYVSSSLVHIHQCNRTKGKVDLSFPTSSTEGNLLFLPHGVSLEWRTERILDA
jgi:hypothetical protein